MFTHIDGHMYARNRSYALVPQQISAYLSKEELHDAKKELETLRKEKCITLANIEDEKRNLDDRITAEELQFMMFPLETLEKHIKELEFLIKNSRIKD